MQSDRSSRLPRLGPAIGKGVSDESSGASASKAAAAEDEISSVATASLIPAPPREEDRSRSTGVTPWSDLLQYSQLPEVPRLLGNAEEIKQQSFPGPPPQAKNDSKAPHLPPVFYAKRHRLTIFNYSETMLDSSTSDCCFCDDDGQQNCPGQNLQGKDEVVRFTQLSSKLDYCYRMKNSYQFQNDVVEDDTGALRHKPPRICAVCYVKMKASLLPDLRHQYRFTFFHTIHIYTPPGLEVRSDLSLAQKSKIEPLSTMKIYPVKEQLKPEVITLLQVTHFLRVATSVLPDNTPAMIPRPLPPEFREPRLVIIDEDVPKKAEVKESPPPPPPTPHPQPDAHPHSEHPHSEAHQHPHSEAHQHTHSEVHQHPQPHSEAHHQHPHPEAHHQHPHPEAHQQPHPHSEAHHQHPHPEAHHQQPHPHSEAHHQHPHPHSEAPHPHPAPPKRPSRSDPPPEENKTPISLATEVPEGVHAATPIAAAAAAAAEEAVAAEAAEEAAEAAATAAALAAIAAVTEAAPVHRDRSPSRSEPPPDDERPRLGRSPSRSDPAPGTTASLLLVCLPDRPALSVDFSTLTSPFYPRIRLLQMLSLA